MRRGASVRRTLGALALSLGVHVMPGPVVAQEESALRRQLESAVGGVRWRNASWGVLVVSLDRGDTLFAFSPDSALAPASNLKLLTTAAALDVLGPEYRFRTYLLTDGDVVDGVVEGDLVLFGTGDPGISRRFYASPDVAFRQLIDQLEEAGIHSVRGDLVADGSYLAGPLRPDGWDPRDLNDHFTAPVGALSFNENVVSFRITADGPVGSPARVSTIPDHAGLTVVNEARIVSGRARPRVWILRDDPMQPVKIVGEISAGARDVWRQLTVSSPALFTGSVFSAALADRGIRVLGGLRTVERPAQSVVTRISAPAAGLRGSRVLATHVSEPLHRYLEVINKESNNLFAELVFRTLGRVSEGVGTLDAGARAVRGSLERLGVDTRHVVQVDGSGLSAANRVTAGTLVDVLSRMSEGPLWREYWGSLPEAGKRGELGRMYRTAAAGNLRAKTGTIEGVSALSGVVRSADGERMAFSILLNGTPSTSRAKAIENEVGIRLASFRRGEGLALPLRTADLAGSETPIDAGPDRHKVAYGENLTLIAQRYGLTVNELLGANPRLASDRILAGQWLALPQSGGRGGL